MYLDYLNSFMVASRNKITFYEACLHMTSLQHMLCIQKNLYLKSSHNLNHHPMAIWPLILPNIFGLSCRQRKLLTRLYEDVCR